MPKLADDGERERRRAVVRAAIVGRFVPRIRTKPARSPAAQAADDSAGKAASENATPMRLTGTLWKLRAKLTDDEAALASADATRVKNRKVSGSIGRAGHPRAP